MNEYRMKIWGGILAALGFIVCMYLVIGGQRDISWFSFGRMLLGLGGLLSLLYIYNRGFNRNEKH